MIINEGKKNEGEKNAIFTHLDTRRFRPSSILYRAIWKDWGEYNVQRKVRVTNEVLSHFDHHSQENTAHTWKELEFL